MSTMAVQRKHAHERVSFGVRSGTILVPAELVPDYNHDGKIDDSDRGKVTTDNPYRYWVNDDSDSTGDDVPADTTNPDGQQVSVQGMGDLEDFFPLFLI
jgi:hypothetical protein